MEKMSGFQNQKFEDLEMTKLKLADTKKMVSEMRNKISKRQEELEAGAAQHYKKMKNLSNVQATQTLKTTKLDNDIKNAESVLTSRLWDQKNVVRMNAENEEALMIAKEETKAMVEESQNRCEELENSIKQGYLQIQTDKDLEALLEVSLNILKDPAKVSLVMDVLMKRKEFIMQRRQDLNKELTQLELMQNKLSKEIKERQEELAASKEKYAELFSHYNKIRKIKRGY